MIVCKSQAELEKMHRAGLVIWEVLNELRGMARPGVSTKELDEYAERKTAERKVRPAFKNYRGYPATLCTSVNSEVVHGIPLKSRVLQAGDIISLDFGVECEGYYADAAVTVPVGEISPELKKLLQVTRESLDLAIEKVRVGNRLSICVCHANVERVFLRALCGVRVGTERDLVLLHGFLRCFLHRTALLHAILHPALRRRLRLNAVRLQCVLIGGFLRSHFPAQ